MTFDLGSHMAFARNYGARDPYAGHVDFKGTRVVRAADTLVWLENLIRPGRNDWPDVVVFERPFARGQHATRALWGLAGLIEAVFGKHAAVLDWTPSEIKLWATGDAKAPKEKMIGAARRMGYTGDNEHEADAWCLLRMAEATLTKELAQ